MVSAFLLASRDLWNVEARAVGGLLRGAGVPNRVITAESQLGKLEVGRLSRSGHQRGANAPVIVLRARRAAPARPAAAVACAVAFLAVVGALAGSRRVPTPLKGLVLVVGLGAAGTLAYGAWWSALAPLDVGHVLVDWRTSALAPIVGVALLFAYDIYPLPGGFAFKTVWLGLALVLTAVFSVIRFAFVAAGYAAFGPSSFLGLFQIAGTFWDIVPGIAVLALAHGALSLTDTLTRPALFWRPRVRS